MRQLREDQDSQPLVPLRPLISDEKDMKKRKKKNYYRSPRRQELIMECGIVLVKQGVAMVTNTHTHIKEMANRHGGNRNTST